MEKFHLLLERLQILFSGIGLARLTLQERDHLLLLNQTLIQAVVFLFQQNIGVSDILKLKVGALVQEVAVGDLKLLLQKSVGLGGFEKINKHFLHQRKRLLSEELFVVELLQFLSDVQVTTH